ncbi:phosphopantetheine-binding protein [Rhodovulum adriaticum]|uniref:Phosphopantetheine binding protein n=1 Tax=Rhodovulum adriaticum TaxID=35804 RepID=A0A4R2NTL4_RHOAD|nr:phosphopantetheine-binding protein [Rhodovulum adriaticum]MBK1635014.1 hypothetical protein [Rhodovulum adriaticum]TCP25353.1 phosphopantetheine binding protein [Rhodovulum adriaticum]
MMISRENVLAVLTEVFEDLGDDLELETTDLTPDSKLLDLGLESISLVYLVSELQQHFGLGDRVFKALREEGRLLKDMTVDDIVTSVLRVGAPDCV